MSWLDWFRRRREPQSSSSAAVAVGVKDTATAPGQPRGAPSDGQSDIQIAFLAEGEQTGEQIAGQLAAFIGGARRTLAIAAYDFRLSPRLGETVIDALRERAAAGVAIRFVYDSNKASQPHLLRGTDPAPTGTSDFIESLGYPSRRIQGIKLMHHKYVVRDAGLPSAAVWTGSTNFTDDAWTIEENTILQLASADIAACYADDFEELWRDGDIENTGAAESLVTTLTYAGAPAHLRLFFAPGCGQTIDEEVARVVVTARRRVRICSMLLNSSALVNALLEVLRAGSVPVDGVYDETQMQEVFQQWQEVPHNHWKIPAVHQIIQQAHLAGKRSTPYSPTSRHDFMHNKTLVVDDTVITGSYNFSHSAEQNAENILFIASAPLAMAYSSYIDHLKRKYGPAQ